ncbi:DUF2750 domain-containing protein [Desulfonema ishimotonii]|uniref:DUF2750 domain-containing protein n=2 Tax=Desulfonema ishimotonii TaxID=45657 RepID=A0A401G2H0_9BACT|nr:DUF2750 domain-containing protein [Desulfonema ishimotonii]
MHEKQIENLLNLSAEERYDFFIRHCAGFEEVWGLSVEDDNWIVFRDKDGDDVFPVWPHTDLAEVCCFDEHKDLNAKPRRIQLDEFLQECIPEMVADKIWFGIFFNHKREGLIIDGNRLKKALEEEVRTVWE